MNPKTIGLIAGLGIAGVLFGVGIGWRMLGPQSPAPAAVPANPTPLLAKSAPLPASLSTTPAPSPGAVAAQRSALLVGIKAYQYADGTHLRNLEGPVNDVDALAQTLRNHWGFNRITVLKDAEATRAAILKNLDELTAAAEPGSHILFFYSGHGTSKQDREGLGGGLPLLETTGAMLAYDSIVSANAKTQDILNSLLIGRRDLRPRFEQLDQKGGYLTVWLDACFSQNSSYAAQSDPASSRIVTLPPADSGEFGEGTAYQPYPYRHGTTFSASAATETALDIDQDQIAKYPTFDGRYHGAFSDALLRALNDRALPDYGALDKNADGVVSVEEFTNGVESFMQGRGYDHTPKLLPIRQEDQGGMRQQALFYAVNQRQASTPPAAADPGRPQFLRVAFTGSADQRRQLAEGRFLELVASGADLTVAAQSAGYQLHNKAGTRIGVVADFATLHETLRRHAALNQLLNTSRRQGRATVGLELASAYAANRLPLGDTNHRIEVPLTLQADQTGYPVVLDLFGDGVVQMLYPLEKQQEYLKPLAAGQNQNLLCVRTEPPTGIDTVYVFLLDKPLPTDVLRDQRIAVANGNGFNALLDRLDQPGRVLGADQLPLEIYQASSSELQAWPKGGCQ